MFDNKTIGFIGAGNMGQAMIKGLIASKTVTPQQIIAADVNTSALAALKDAYIIQTTTDNKHAAQQADILILSVKPQIMPLLDIQDAASTCEYVLSIAAGVSVSEIVSRFNHQVVVRVMPNTPAMIGQGMSVWTATDDLTQAQHEQTRVILSALGEELYVTNETLLDAATAISGSGPAYVFLFLEAMIEAGVHLGFSRHQAQTLALQTLKGAALYAEASELPAATLRNQVTSPAGTTAEALYHMEKEGLRHAVARGVWAAYQRSVLLGGGTPRNPEG